MKHSEKLETIERIFKALDELVPEYLANPLDYAISRGGSAACIIDDDGCVYGRLFGTDKIRCRETFKVAWTKASQVWITGYKTNEFEKLVFADKLDHHQFGINMPDLIGWEGGQPIKLQDGTILSIGYSGFRGKSDLEIVVKAFEKAGIATK